MRWRSLLLTGTACLVLAVLVLSLGPVLLSPPARLPGEPTTRDVPAQPQRMERHSVRAGAEATQAARARSSNSASPMAVASVAADHAGTGDAAPLAETDESMWGALWRYVAESRTQPWTEEDENRMDVLRSLVQRFKAGTLTTMVARAERGILYTCYGKCLEKRDTRNVLHQAVRMARKQQEWQPGIRIGLVVDREPGDMLFAHGGSRLRDAFDDVIVVPVLQEHGATWFSRVLAWLHTPYTVTMTMDSDAWLCQPVDPVFDEADILHLDMAFGDHSSWFHLSIDRQRLPDNGVVLYRRSPGTAYAFEKVLEKFVVAHDDTVSDQRMFEQALYDSDRPIWAHELFRQGRFTNSVGYRQFKNPKEPQPPQILGQPPPPTRRAGHPVLGPVRVLHVRALIQQAEQVCDLVNQNMSTRVIGRHSYNQSSTVHILYEPAECEEQKFYCAFSWHVPRNHLIALLPGKAHSSKKDSAWISLIGGLLIFVAGVIVGSGFLYRYRAPFALWLRNTLPFTASRSPGHR